MLQGHIFEIMVGLLSSLVTLGAAHVVTGQKLAFMQGKMDLLMKAVAKADELDKRVDTVEVRQGRHEVDLRHAHDKIRALQTSHTPKPLKG